MNKINHGNGNGKTAPMPKTLSAEKDHAIGELQCTSANVDEVLSAVSLQSMLLDRIHARAQSTDYNPFQGIDAEIFQLLIGQTQIRVRCALAHGQTVFDVGNEVEKTLSNWERDGQVTEAFNRYHQIMDHYSVEGIGRIHDLREFTIPYNGRSAYQRLMHIEQKGIWPGKRVRLIQGDVSVSRVHYRVSRITVNCMIVLEGTRASVNPLLYKLVRSRKKRGV